jgi:hypothetical protein
MFCRFNDKFFAQKRAAIQENRYKNSKKSFSVLVRRICSSHNSEYRLQHWYLDGQMNDFT